MSETHYQGHAVLRRGRRHLSLFLLAAFLPLFVPPDAWASLTRPPLPEPAPWVRTPHPAAPTSAPQDPTAAAVALYRVRLAWFWPGILQVAIAPEPLCTRVAAIALDRIRALPHDPKTPYIGVLRNAEVAADIARVEKDSQGQPHNVAISSAYQYNQSGIRTKANSTTTIAGQAPYDTTRIFLNDGMNMTGYSQVLEELPVLGVTPTVSYVMGDDVLGQTNTAGTRWLGCDGHGSTRLLSDSSGGITDRFSFDAYGCQLGPKANVVNPATTSLLYSGETQDFDLDMQYLRARYYDQSVGAFASLDPAQGNNYDPRSLHKYAYAGLDPVNGADPSGEDFSLTGLLCSTAIGAIIGAIAGGVYAKYSGNNVWKGILIGAGVGALFGATVYLLWSGVAALKSGALQRFFWDNRAFDIIRRQYWQQYGPASGRSLHHWLVPQRWTWLPQGIRNAGFNLLEMPKILSGPLGLNQWMGFALRWGGSRYVVAMMIEGEIKVLLPITALATYHAGKWAGNELAAEVLNLDDGATATPLKLSSEEEEELQEDTGRAFLEEL